MFQIQSKYNSDNSKVIGRLKLLRIGGYTSQISALNLVIVPNASKTTLVVKEDFIDEATTLFRDTGIDITVEGHRMFGAACGKRSFVDGSAASKIKEWESEIGILSQVAEMYPNAVYIVFSRDRDCTRRNSTVKSATKK